MNKTWTCTMISVLLCVTCSGSPSRANEISRELIKQVQPSIVTVLTYNKAGYKLAQGSGFIFKAEARLITNYHLLGEAAMARIRTPDGRLCNVKAIVGEDKANDLVEAMIDAPNGAVKPLRLARIEPRPGDPIIVVGSPMGVDRVVTGGSVMDIRQVEGHGKVIVYNAHSYPGSSGSPLVNGDGEVVGVVSFGVAPNINYAIPVERISAMKRAWRTLASPPAADNESIVPDAAIEIESVKKLAEAGDPDAQVKLALFYEEGKGVSKNCRTALDLYRKAAERQFLPALYQLGRVFYDGKCVSTNYGEAAKWFRKAAERGHAEAQSALGTLYLNGEGVSRDRVQAYMWTYLAASQGNETAGRTIRLLSAELTRVEIHQAQDLIRNWKPAK